MSAEVISLIQHRDKQNAGRLSGLIDRVHSHFIAKLSIPRSKISKIDKEFDTWLGGNPNNFPTQIVEKTVSLIVDNPDDGIDNGTLSIFISALKGVPYGALEELKSKICFGLEITHIDELDIDCGPFLMEVLRK